MHESARASERASERTRVLVAIKRPAVAASMLERAKGLAADGAKLWVVHVLDLSLDTAPAGLMDQLETAEGWLRNALTDAGLGANALPLVVVGKPAGEIVAAVNALDADVILLGAEGVGTPGEHDVGHQVQAGAPCPVVFFELEGESPATH